MTNADKTDEVVEVNQANKSESKSEIKSDLERNKSIMWSRYLIDSTDWLIYSSKITRMACPTTASGSAIKLFSCSLLSPEGRVVFESMLKPQEEIPANLIAEHGLEYSVVFNAQPFSTLHQQLSRYITNRQLIAYDLLAEQHVLDELCTFYAQPDLILGGHSIEPEYSRYIGDIDESTNRYKRQPLKVKGVGATYRCRAILDALYGMASSSQKTMNAAPGNLSWTGEFYRPKANARDKFKGFLGL